MSIILASQSPRRRELLAVITPDFKIIPSDIEEIVPNNVGVIESPEYLAKIKAQDIAKKHPNDIVIGADTSVILGDVILGKPKDRQNAYEMLKMLSGNTHIVVTGCAIVNGDKTVSFSVKSEVEFYPLTDEEINAYLDTDEPYDKAGSYGIQAKGALLVKEIRGDYFNIVGLPIAELSRKLTEFI
ncbi:MAG: septum formation protein Maf [Clostridia bacterium]|nr:septum formation protein Maf [Clostridia bacterium]